LNDIELEALCQLKDIVAVSDEVSPFLSKKLTVALADPPERSDVDD